MKFVKAEVIKVTDIKAEDVDCKEILPDICGWLEGEYMGRKIVLVDRNPERFGGIGLKTSGRTMLTLHNGILNHMGIREGKGSPTPYWAVMDAMSDLKDGFTMEQVVSKAMGILGDDKYMGACKIAWYVLKSHQTHPKERDRGMSFIIETVKPGEFKLRARRKEETQEYFDQCREERKKNRVKKVKVGKKGSKSEKIGEVKEVGEVEEAGVVLATHVVNEVS